MSNELSTSVGSGFLNLIEKVVSNPEGNIQMLEKIIEVQERVMDKQAEIDFNADLALMLSEIPVIAKTSDIKVTTKNGGSFGIKYAALDEIVEVVRPIMSKYGFSVNFKHEQTCATLVKVTCILRHKHGHSESNEITLPLDNSGSKNSVQAVGSTITYGKRYTLCSSLNIATGNDNDGFTVSADAANKKQTLNERRFADAVEAVKKKSFSLDRLFSDYELTAQQKSYLNEIFMGGGDATEE